MGVLLAACGEDPASTGDRLTREEALTIAEGVTSSGASASGSLRAAPGGMDVAAAPPRTFTVDHESNHPCPRGGRIGIALEVSFSVDNEERDYSFDAEGSLTHQACAYIVEEGVTLTVTGDPDISYEAHAAVQDGQPQGNFTSEANGAVNWSASDGRTGRCVVELSDVTDFAARKRTIAGEVCGHTINQVTTWT
jgi:hypothetical protein